MGKKRGPGTVNPASRGQVTLRQETSGIKQNKGGSKSSQCALKLEHMQRLAVWASREASIPSLGAYFGCHLAAVGEAIGVLSDPSMFSCQRCETVLQPGRNCTIRIDVVFKYHFCSHRNMKRGTPKDHMKLICPSKDNQSSERHLRKCASLEEDMRRENGTDKKTTVDIPLPAVAMEIIPIVESPATPLPKTITLLDSKKRRNRIGPKKPDELESNPGSTNNEKSDASNKRRRKSWTSLKDIAENQRSRNVANMTIPFIL